MDGGRVAACGFRRPVIGVVQGAPGFGDYEG